MRSTCTAYIRRRLNRLPGTFVKFEPVKLPMLQGAVALARDLDNPDSGSSQFFI